MANQRDPNAPYQPGRTDDEIRRVPGLDHELQPDPELADGPASGGRIALFAVAIVVVLGAVFYGLNNTSHNPTGTNTAQTTTTDQNTAQPAPVPPGVRDVTPRNNAAPGVTTGAASTRPPAAVPYGANQNRSDTPPANNAPATK